MGFLKIHQLPKGTQINDKDEFLYSDINGDTKTVTADKVHSFIKSKQQSGAKKLEAALKDHDKRIKENKDEIAKPHHTTMIVTAMTEGIGFKSDYNATQIKKYADAGGTIILRFNAPDGSGEQSYNYETYKDGFAIFRRAAIIGGKSKRIVIKINDLFNVYKTEEDANYYTKEETVTLVSDRAGNKVTLNVDENFIMTLKLLNAKGNELSRAAIDLPLETMVVNAKFDSKTKELVIVLENGNELRVPIGDLVKGLVSQNTFDAAVKDLQQQIIANNDELNNLVIEVSDVQQDIGLIRKDQTLQNKAIQKNVDDIHENKRNIGSNTNRVQNIENALYNSGQATGEFINVKDSTLAEQQSVEMSIAKAQETTKGYQLFKNNKSISSKNGIDFDFNKEILKIKGETGADIWSNVIYTPDNTIILNRYWYTEAITNNDVFTSKNTTYTIKIEVKNNFDSILYLFIGTDKKTTRQKLENNTTNIFKYTGDKLSGIGIGCYENSKYDAEVKILLYEGEEEKSFEPYTGGMPSPNPNFKQDIAKVEGSFNYGSCSSNLINTFMLDGQKWDTSKIKVDNKGIINISNATSSTGCFRTPLTFKDLCPMLKENDKFTIRVISTSDRSWLYWDGINQAMGSTTKVVTKELMDSTLIVYGGYQRTDTLKITIQYGEKEPSQIQYEPYTGTTTNIDLKGNTMLPNDKLRLAFKIPERLPHIFLDKNRNSKVYTRDEIVKQKTQTYENIDYAAIPKPIDDINYGSYFMKRFICNKATIGSLDVFDTLSNIGKYTTPAKDLYWIGFPKGTTDEEMKNKLEGLEIAYELKDENKSTIDLGSIDLMPFTFFPITNVFTSIDNININMKYYQNPVNTQKYIKDTLKDLDTRLKALESKPAQVVQVIQEPTESEVVPNEH